MRILGVYPFVAPEPCHLIEVELATNEVVDWNSITQPTDEPKMNWQASWNEQPIEFGENRWVFFVHYLNPSAPLQIESGLVKLPQETSLPNHLSKIVYENPCD